MHYKIHVIDVKNALKNYIWLLALAFTSGIVGACVAVYMNYLIKL